MFFGGRDQWHGMVWAGPKPMNWWFFKMADRHKNVC